MSLSELLDHVKALPRGDQLRMIEALAHELATAETTSIEPSRSFPVWSPHEAYSAADVMLRSLEAERTAR